MTQTAVLPVLNYIAGEWIGSSSGETTEDRNPARSDEILGQATASTAEDVRRAIDAAEAAFRGWRATPAPQRGDIVRKAADLMERRRDELARLLTQEEGKVLAESLAEVDRAITSDDRVKAISFTGSSAVGRRLYTQAAERLCKVQLEMGGKNAVIVMDDADLEKAAESVATGAFGATGQRCTATSRAVVVRSVLAEFTDLLADKAETWRAGDGLEAGVRMGPIVDETQLRKVRAKIDEGKRSGAKVLRDGGTPTRRDLRAGYFVEPTIFSDVDPRAPLAQEIGRAHV